MLAPKAIKKETEEMKDVSKKAFKALNDDSLSKDEANTIIDECNRQYIALGGPWGGQTMKRK